MLSYYEFITEADDMSKPVEPGISLNYADETMEGLRRKLLDDYMPLALETVENADKKINQCITTYVYALDKHLKIDEDVIALLAKCVGSNSNTVRGDLSKRTNEFYDKSKNIIG